MNGAITAVEAYYNHGELYDNLKNHMDEDVRQRMMEGKKYSASQYLGMVQQRLLDIDLFVSQMRGFDALVLPTAFSAPPALSDINQDINPSRFTRPFNYLGMCGLSLPTILDSDGLPNSIQVVGKANNEEMIIRVGALIEKKFSVGIAPAKA